MKKVVLITGASSKIGEAISRELIKDYEVILHYNTNKNRIATLKEKLEKEYNKKVLTIRCNLSCEEEIDNMLKEIYSQYQNIDILINNAAITIDTVFEDKTKENFIKTLDVNLVAPFLLSKKIGPKMKENKDGIIINISSTNGIDTPYIESIDYDASKAGLISLSNNLANYLSPYVRVNTVCPGWINTDINKDLDKDFVAKEIDKILLGRFGEPEEVSHLIKFLVSDEAQYINNSIIRIDGGKRC